MNGKDEISNYRERIASHREIVHKRVPALAGTAEYPLVTVITQTLNSKATVRAAIESVLGQTYPSIEYILVDGGSNDGTLEYAIQNADLFALILSGNDVSPADAANKGVSLSGGEFICILPSDDVYEPDYVANAVRAMLRSGCDFAYGDLIYEQQGRDPLLIPGEANYPDTIRYAMPNMSAITLMYKRSAFDKIGLWNVNNRYCPDYDWLLRAHIAGLSGCYDASILARFRHGGISSANYFASMASALDVALAHGGPWLRATGYYWGAVFRKHVRESLYHLLPKSLFHVILRLVTRTGVRPLKD